MRESQRTRPLVWLAAALLASLQLACETNMSEIFDMDGPDRGTRADKPIELPLGTFTRDSLHCALGRCVRWYEIEVLEPGMLRVDVYAPVGDGLPDCELSLEDEDGEPILARTGRVQTQRRLRYETGETGLYRLRITSAGTNDELFDFEVVAAVRQLAGGTVAKKRPPPTPPKKRSRPPEIPQVAPPSQPEASDVDEEPTVDEPELLVPESPEALGPALPEEPPAPEAVWVVAEVLDVEESGGRPTAVMVEAGTPDGIEPGMQGELFEADVVIGRIEVVDVYPTGSRAKILGELTAPVSFDTFSRIEIPAQ